MELTWHLYSVLLNISKSMSALCRCSKIKVSRLIQSPWDALSVYPHAWSSTSSWWLYDSCFFEQFTRYLTEILWKVLVREFVFLSRPKHFATSFSRACWGRLFVVPWKINNPLKHYSQERYTLSASWIWCRDCCKMMLELKEFRNFVVSKSVLVSTNDQFFATTW